MNINYDVYKFLLKNLSDLVNLLCDNQINIMNECYDEKIYEVLQENNEVLNEISYKLNTLNSNIDYIIDNSNMEIRNNDCEVENVISNECNKIYNLSDEVKDLLDGTNIEHNQLLDSVIDECNKLIYMTNEVINMLQGIIFDSNSNNMIMIVIKDKIEATKKEVISINNEANYITSLSYEQLINNNELYNFCMYLSSKITNSKNMIMDIIQLKENNDSILTTTEEVSLNLLEDILEQQFDNLVNVNDELFRLINEEQQMDDINDLNDKKLNYEQEMEDKLKELLDENADSENMINSLYKLFSKYHSKSIDDDTSLDLVDKNEKEADTKEYKKYYSLLNKSFWEARQYVSTKKVKYPSASYEKKVKEYQNNYLIDNYNISLEEAKNYIEEYENKYASDIYIDSVYSSAMDILREETCESVDEICDESNGISKLDSKVYEILNKDLMQTIREIGIAKKEENMDDFVDVSKYKKSYKISKLIDKRDMIRKHIQAIEKRASYLEGLAQ